MQDEHARGDTMAGWQVLQSLAQRITVSTVLSLVQQVQQPLPACLPAFLGIYTLVSSGAFHNSPRWAVCMAMVG